MPVLLALGGCLSGPRELTYLDEADLSHYRDVATRIVDPSSDDDRTETSRRAEMAAEPRRLSQPGQQEIWDLSLQETMKIGLRNSEIIRESGTFLSPSNRLLNNPEFAASVFNPAIQETNVQFGQRGVEAASADFDATFSSSMTWGGSSSIQRINNLGLSAGDTLDEDTGRFRASLSKITGAGTQMSLSHNWDYTANNQPNQMFPSSFFGTAQSPTLGLQMRHPLLAGAGTKYTQIAGPRLGRFGGATSIVGVNQGVVISRINSDITLTDFEVAIRNLVKDIEDQYWDLHLAYRVYHTQKVALDSSEQTWRMVQGDPRRPAAEKAQARDNYFEIKGQTESARSDLYSAESRLRRLIGLPVNDGRIIRPSDEPITAQFTPDWKSSLVDALTRRVELRRQKWSIK
ncbi:TolC family protein, partial [Planctomycetaceae bacterium]|nr:TolC family protein [Planctomycetaceae bacterium]